jgi:hypothetical protein
MVSAYERAKRAFALIFADRCTVYTNAKTKNPVTGETEFTQTAIITDEPCRLSFSNSPAADGGHVAALTQSVRLFISPDVEIPPGSKIEVIREGKTQTYSSSGEPARYVTHQEINLELFRGWA